MEKIVEKWAWREAKVGRWWVGSSGDLLVVITDLSVICTGVADQPSQ